MEPARNPLPPATSRQAIAERLRQTREALGLRPIEVCRATGIRPTAYSNYETARNRPNLDDMIRYAEIYGVTLDWIYRGDPAGLPHRIAKVVLKYG